MEKKEKKVLIKIGAVGTAVTAGITAYIGPVAAHGTLMSMMSATPVIAKELDGQVSANTVKENDKKSDIKWEIDPISGILYISGTGEIPDYTTAAGNNPAPWSNSVFKTGYSCIMIGSGVTHVGSNAFALDDNNGSVSIIYLANDNVSIAKDAFNGLTNLEQIGLPKNAKMEKDAFRGCKTKDIVIEGTEQINNLDVSGLAITRYASTHLNISEGLEAQLKKLGATEVTKGMICLRESITKDENGKYHCNDCGSEIAPPSYSSSGIYKAIIGDQEYKVDQPLTMGKLYELDVLTELRAQDKACKGYIQKEVEFNNETKGESVKLTDPMADRLVFPATWEISDMVSEKISFSEVPISVSLAGGEYHKIAVSSIRRQGDTITFPENLESSNSEYAFAGWRLYNKAGKPITDKTYMGKVDMGELLEDYYGSKKTVVKLFSEMSQKRTAEFPDEIKAVAQWVKKDGKFTVIYNPNGGTGTKFAEEHKLYKDGATELSFAENVDIEREGYAFIGWNTKPDGSGKQLDTVHPVTGTSFGSRVVKDGESVELYAQWKEFRKVIVEVEFDDNDNCDGIRPDEISYQLATSMGTSEDSTIVDSYKMSVKEGNSLKKEVLVRPIYAHYMYGNGGMPISMTWKDTKTELILGKNTSDVKGYTVSLEKVSTPAYTSDGARVSTSTDSLHYKLVYKHVPEKTEQTYTLIWNDDGNNDGKRPSKLDVTLKGKDGSIIKKTVNVSSDNKSEFKISDLNKYYAKGLKNDYTISVAAVNGYTFKISGDKITGTHRSETSIYNFKTVWDDKDNKDKVRPDSYTVTLKGDGQKDNTLFLTDGKGSLEGVKTYYKGKKVNYSVEVSEVTGYTSEVSINGTNVVIKMTHKVSEGSTGGGSSSSGTGSSSSSSPSSSSSSSSTGSSTGRSSSSSSLVGGSGTSCGPVPSSTGSGSGSTSSSVTSTPGSTGSASSETTYQLRDEDYATFSVRLIWNDKYDDVFRFPLNIVLRDSRGKEYMATLENRSVTTVTIPNVALVDDEGKDLTFKCEPETRKGFVLHVRQNQKDKTHFDIEAVPFKNAKGEVDGSVVYDDNTTVSDNTYVSPDVEEVTYTPSFDVFRSIKVALAAAGAALIAFIVFLFIKKRKDDKEYNEYDDGYDNYNGYNDYSYDQNDDYDDYEQDSYNEVEEAEEAGDSKDVNEDND